MEKGKQSCDVSKGFSPKELYKELTTIDGSVPDAFVRLDEHHSILAPTSNEADPSVPIIDLHGLDNIEIDDDLRRGVVEKLHSASQNWGLFLVVNHGVDVHVLEKLKLEIEEFFKLPLEEKVKYRIKEGEAEGYGQNLTTPLQENQKLDWADRFYMITSPPSLRKPHLFPMLPPSLRESLEKYFEEVEKVAKNIMGWMAEGLGMEKREVEKVFDKGMRSVRMTYYPPHPNPDHVVGITPHSDATLVTLLLQLNGVGGLQVKKDGRWNPVHIPPHALVVNVGDLMEIVSNGKYKSVEHKVSVNSAKERVSIAVFFNPKLEAQLGPSPSLISPSNPPLFNTVAMHNYVKDYFTTKLDGKSYLDRMRIIDTTLDEHTINRNAE